MRLLILGLLILFTTASSDTTVQYEPSTCPLMMPSNVECGYLTVPEDRAVPDSPTIRLAVAIYRTRSSEPAPDPLLFLDGGPGSCTLDAWSRGLDSLVARVGRDRDIILFDQRGMGYSSPALTCPEQVRDDASEHWLNHCRDRLVSEGIQLAAYNTRESASDAADLMRALGYTRYNVWGGSYGSSLALALLRDHPDGIRSVVVTAMQPPQVSLQVLLAPMFEHAFNLVAEQCAADSACNSAYPGSLWAKLNTVIARLNETPFEFDLNGETQTLDGSLLIGGITELLRYDDYIPTIPALIEALYHEQYDTIVPYAQALTQPPNIDNPIGAYWSIRCADSALAATPEQMRASLEAVDPVLHDYYWNGYERDRATCEMWGAHVPTEAELAPAVSDVPVLVLNGEFDPFSSPDNVAMILETLPNGYAFSFPGHGHGVNQNTCAQRIFYDFVTNPAQMPDATCIERIPHLRFQLP